ncbi:tyrosine-type recombinase/integrase [Aeromonas hydrophila]|uniref:tyrosine-type recombinase/integrase n=1 Tax=Aeromonas hydrophila TaxID=644 RepID=UPI002B45C56C|nr:tyrosine-type recombinase/integrase [Aeromonas hydrophila]
MHRRLDGFSLTGKSWSVSLAIPKDEDINKFRQFVKQKVSPVFKSFSSTISDKWQAYELLQRLLMSRGYGEARALAVIAECEQKSAQRGYVTPETHADFLHMVNEAITPFGGPLSLSGTASTALGTEAESQPPVSPVVTPELLGMNISECFDRFLKLRLKDWKQSTAMAYLNTQGRLDTLGLGSIPVADLKRSQLDSIRQAMIDAGQKAGTINLLFRQVKQAITEIEQAYGEDEGFDWSRALKNLTSMKALKDDAKTIDRAWPTEAIQEVSAKLADKMNSPHTTEPNKVRRKGAYWQLWLSLATGCRRGEAESLKVSDIVRDDESGKYGIHIRGTKTQASNRLVPLVDDLNGFNLADFLSYVETLPSEGSLLCAGGSLENLSKTERSSYKMSNDAGLTLHGLRHTAATTLATLGLEPALLSQFMGHSGATLGGSEVTLRYITGALDARRHEWLKLHEAIEPLVQASKV